MIACNYCGATGRHMTSECPELTTNGKPGWCGNCDPRTRLIDHGTYMSRCADCHPNAHKTLAHHKRCGGCRKTVYAFDDSKCGEHTPLGIDDRGHRVTAEPVGRTHGA